MSTLQNMFCSNTHALLDKMHNYYSRSFSDLAHIIVTSFLEMYVSSESGASRAQGFDIM